jgi:hypothetical protein
VASRWEAAARIRSTAAGRERSGLPAAREPCSADEPDRVGGDALGLDGALEDRAEQIESVADRGGAGAGGEPVGLPARDRLSPDRS